MSVTPLALMPRGGRTAAPTHADARATVSRHALAVLRRHGWTALRLTVCVALLLAAVSAAGRIDASVEVVDIPLLGLALALIALQVGALALAWSAIIGRLGQAPIESGISTFVAGWLGRYIPGPQTGPAAKFAAARRRGIPCAVVAGALIHEQALQLIALLVLVAATIPLLAGPTGLGWSVLALAGAGLIGVGLLRPDWALRLCPSARLRTHLAGALSSVDRRALLGAGCWFIAANVCAGLSVHVLAVGLGGWSPAAVGETVCVVALAALASSLAPVPSGLGVREGIIVALMGPAIGAPAALTVAVLARALAVLFDTALGAGVVAHRSVGTLQRAARAAQTVAAKP